MKEKTENKLEIVDFDAKIVEAAVKYFYDYDTLNYLLRLKWC